ncbi:MAG: hypothetical protein IJI73_05825 [Kiritimatiellae bacterium]|nr:hypothetical protein [Kiritimatiellia bacterium]
MKRLYFAAFAAFAASAAFAGRPVAKWDVVPYQRVEGVFKAGVVAFHEKSVKVEFSVDGKKAFTAEAPTLNDRTGVWEFVFPFDAAKFKDGPVTLGAKAVAETGESYSLPPLSMYANAGKTLGSDKIAWVDPKNGNEFSTGLSREQAVKTIRQAVQKAGDGGTVYLLPGDYQARMIGGGKARKYWTLLTPAPGVERSQVKFSRGRTGTDKLIFRNVELYCDCADGDSSIILGEGGKSVAWFDNCRFYNKQGRHGGNTSLFGNRLHAYITGGVTEDIGNGPCCEFVRGHEIRNIACDAFTYNGCLVVNCTVDGIDAGAGAAFDPDLFNGFAVAPKWCEDNILYNVKATNCRCRGLSGQRLRNSAFVNVVFQGTGGDLVYSRFSEDMDNVLFAHMTLVDQKWQWMQTKNGRGDFKPKDVRFLNCVMKAMEGYEKGDGSTGLLVDRCAWYNRDFYGKTMEFGVNPVVVERAFAGESSANFALPPGSPAASAGTALQCVPADVNGAEYPSGARPCGAYAK